MTPVAVITLGVLVVLVLRAKGVEDLFSLSLTALIVYSINNITAPAFYIGGQEVNCDDLVLIVCAISATALLVKGLHVSRHQIISINILFLIITLSFITCLFIDGSIQIITASQSWDLFYYGYEMPGRLALTPRCVLVTVRMAVFCLIVIVAQAEFTQDKLFRIAGFVVLSGSFHVCYTLIELVIKSAYGASSLYYFTSFFGTSLNDYGIRGEFIALSGLTREPSHLAYAMFFISLSGVLLSVHRSLSSREKLTCCFAAVLMIISGAFSSMLLCVALIIFYIISVFRHFGLNSKLSLIDIRIILVLLSAFVVLVLISPLVLNSKMFSYFVSRLENILNNAAPLLTQDYTHLSGTSDSMPRLISIVEAAHVFTQYPWFGVGYGTINPFSTLFGALAAIGFTGFATWLTILCNYARTLSNK